MSRCLQCPAHIPCILLHFAVFPMVCQYLHFFAWRLFWEPWVCRSLLFQSSSLHSLPPSRRGGIALKLILTLTPTAAFNCWLTLVGLTLKLCVLHWFPDFPRGLSSCHPPWSCHYHTLFIGCFSYSVLLPCFPTSISSTSQNKLLLCEYSYQGLFLGTSN